MRIAVFIFLAIGAFGCSTTLKVEKKWEPLERVVETRLARQGLVHAVAPNLYVRDLKKWESEFPKGPWREFILAHERVHVFRQKREGLAKWLSNYAINKKYRWNEERLGVYASIQVAKKYNLPYNLEERARFLSGESYFNMVSYEEAKNWIEEAWSGKWKPSPKDLPGDVN